MRRKVVAGVAVFGLTAMTFVAAQAHSAAARGGLVTKYYQETTAAASTALAPEQAIVDDTFVALLSKTCDAAADAVVVRQESFWGTIPTTGETLPFTRTFLSTVEKIRGDVPASFVVEHPGGVIGAASVGFSHSPRLSPGDRVVLFLGKYDGRPSACSGDVGVFPLDVTGQTVQGRRESAQAFKAFIRSF